jgi:hypothetical protein
MLAWLIDAIMPVPPPNGGRFGNPCLSLLILSPLPLGAFYICARFVRQAWRDERETKPEKTGTG